MLLVGLHGCAPAPDGNASAQERTDRCKTVFARPSNPPLVSEGAFYYWQVEGKLPGLDSLRQYGAKKLYVRYFDVVAGPDGPRPVGIRRSVETDATVIPVVYVTLGALKDLDSESVGELAENIWQLVNRIGYSGGEIQLDCDWTAGTRTTYFALLERLRSLGKDSPGFELSSTIRLHQLKYYQSTGVPPVDRGALMIYNMGQLADPSERNSIFSESVALSYLRGSHMQKYPIPLDLALPDFSWAVAFVHGSFHSILHDVTEKDLSRPELEKRGHEYRVIQPVILDGRRLPAGARIRLESVDACERASVLYALSQELNREDPERALIVFDYDEKKTSAETKDLVDLFSRAGLSW
ncbi:MAG: hypothetical protein CMN76_03160 [Spirochaetaceae bacterium]|nr:hypothetical protein [Spirochaetaceae bacterium]|tara:strand:- start:75678 stop:76736 length:1059 start_codon:yes stop_codon:yes gene_type:complete